MNTLIPFKPLLADETRGEMGKIRLPNFDEMLTKVSKKRKLMKGSHPMIGGVANATPSHAMELLGIPLPSEPLV